MQSMDIRNNTLFKDAPDGAELVTVEARGHTVLFGFNTGDIVSFGLGTGGYLSVRLSTSLLVQFGILLALVTYLLDL